MVRWDCSECVAVACTREAVCVSGSCRVEYKERKMLLPSVFCLLPFSSSSGCPPPPRSLPPLLLALWATEISCGGSRCSRYAIHASQRSRPYHSTAMHSVPLTFATASSTACRVKSKPRRA